MIKRTRNKIKQADKNFLKDEIEWKIQVRLALITAIFGAFFGAASSLAVNLCTDYFRWNNQPIKAIESSINQLAYSNGTITSINGESIEGESVDKGCAINSYFSNTSDRRVAVSRCSLNVQKIVMVEEACPVVLAYPVADNLKIIFLNNGNKELAEGELEIWGEYADREGLVHKINDNDFENIFNIDSNSHLSIDKLMRGELLEIKSFEIDIPYFENWKEKNSSWITLYGNYMEKSSGRQWERIFIGCMDIGNEIYTFRSQGDTDESVKKPVQIDVMEGQQSVPISTEFSIEPRSDKNVQIYILPDESCEISCNIELGAAGEEAITSDSFVQKIRVPLYRDDGDTYENLIRVVQENNIKHYYYNSDSLIQQKIEYSPELLVASDTADESSVNFSDATSKGIIPESDINSSGLISEIPIQDNSTDFTNIIEEKISKDTEVTYEKILKEYKKVAENNFSYSVLKNAQFVNLGLWNFRDQEKYSVYYCFDDLAKDGVPELIISVNEKEAPKEILDIYTIKDGLAKRIIDSNGSVGDRIRYKVCLDGRIKEYNYGGINAENIKFYKLGKNGSSLTLDEQFIYNSSTDPMYTHVIQDTVESISEEIYEAVYDNGNMEFDDKWEVLYEGNFIHYIE